MFDSSTGAPAGASGEATETWATEELADELAAIARQAAIAKCRWLGLLALFDRRSLHASRTYDGMLVIEVVLPVEEGEALLADLEAACWAPEAVDSGPAGPPAPRRQSRIDALVEVVRTERATPAARQSATCVGTMGWWL